MFANLLDPGVLWVHADQVQSHEELPFGSDS